MRKPRGMLILVLLGALLLPACGARGPVVSTESGEKLITEGGDPLGTYTARLKPHGPYER